MASRGQRGNEHVTVEALVDAVVSGDDGLRVRLEAAVFPKIGVPAPLLRRVGARLAKAAASGRATEVGVFLDKVGRGRAGSRASARDLSFEILKRAWETGDCAGFVAALGCCLPHCSRERPSLSGAPFDAERTGVVLREDPLFAAMVFDAGVKGWLTRGDARGLEAAGVAAGILKGDQAALALGRVVLMMESVPPAEGAGRWGPLLSALEAAGMDWEAKAKGKVAVAGLERFSGRAKVFSANGASGSSVALGRLCVPVLRFLSEGMGSSGFARVHWEEMLSAGTGDGGFVAGDDSDGRMVERARFFCRTMKEVGLREESGCHKDALNAFLDMSWGCGSREGLSSLPGVFASEFDFRGVSVCDLSVYSEPAGSQGPSKGQNGRQRRLSLDAWMRAYGSLWDREFDSLAEGLRGCVDAGMVIPYSGAEAARGFSARDLIEGGRREVLISILEAFELRSVGEVAGPMKRVGVGSSI